MSASEFIRNFMSNTGSCLAGNGYDYGFGSGTGDTYGEGTGDGYDSGDGDGRA